MTVSRKIRLAVLSLVAGLAVAVPAAHAELDADHAAWSTLLERYVHDGVVDYARWKADGDAELDAYLASLESVSPAEYERWDEPARLAFWINTYNAYMVKTVLEAYPIEGVKDLGSLLDPYAVFKREVVPYRGLRGKTLSLDDVEHEILRKEFREPRIHVGVVCASKSCPVIHGEAYRGADLEAQLTLGMERFLADDFRNRADRASNTLYLSKIFDWFGEDFEKAAGSVPAFVAKWAAEEDMKAVAADPDATVDYLDYDWSLNDP